MTAEKNRFFGKIISWESSNEYMDLSDPEIRAAFLKEKAMTDWISDAEGLLNKDDEDLNMRQATYLAVVVLPRALAALRKADELARTIGEIVPVKFGEDIGKQSPAYWSRVNEALAAYREARS